MSKQKALPNFKLAKPVEFNRDKGFPKDVEEVIVEPKLDGYRGFAIVRKGKCKIYTSGGVEVVNGPRIVEDIETLIARGRWNDLCFDGEFFIRNWNDTGSIVKTMTPDHPKRNDLCFRVFDVLSIIEWDTRTGIKPLDSRKRWLEGIFTDATELFAISFIFGKRVKANLQKLEKHMHALVAKGYEGCVLKNLYSVYPFKKHASYGWKLKPYYEADLKVVGHEMGKGQHKGRTGALHCSGRLGANTISVRIGGGLTNQQREEFYKLHQKNKLVGAVVEVKHEGVTVNNSLRFPRLYRVRALAGEKKL